IFPLYYLVLGAFVVHAVVLRDRGSVRDDFLANVPFYATYTSNWFLHHRGEDPIVFAFAWSLATEEQFYLMWPPVLRVCRGVAVPAVVMMSFILLDQGAERGWFVLDGLALRMLKSFATPIGLGALLALATDHRWTAWIVHRAFARRWSSSVMLVLVALAVA